MTDVPPSDGNQTEGRKPDGTFAPGNRIGRGRVEGSRNKASLMVETLMEGEAQAIAQKVIDLAKAGDVTAARMVLDRLAPPRKGRPVAFDLLPMRSAADLPRALGGLLVAVAEGSLTPDEGASVAALLEVQRKALETEELEQRIAALEGKQER